jgi:hypothetical protein
VAISAVQEATDSDVMGLAFFTHPSATGGDAAVEKVRIDADGNVGIGTTTPITKLSLGGYNGARLPYIDGTGYTFNAQGITVPSSNNGNAAIGGGIDLTNNTYSVGAYSPIISFSSLSSNSAYNNSYAGIWGILAGQGGDANWVTGHIAFGTSSSYGISERMRITSAGNVGIGTTAPTAALTVSGTNIGAAIDWNNTTASTGRNFRWVSLNSGGFAVEDITAGSERMRITSAGNVGIGTSNPTQKLQVIGTAQVDNGGINLGGTSSVSGNNPQLRRANSSNDLGIATGGSDRITVLGTGNVGIGTTSPQSKFQVNVGTDQNVAINSTGGVSRISAYDDAASNSVPLIINGSNLRFTNSGTEAVRITGGNVGINQTAPTYTLEVAGDTRTTTLRVDNPGSGPGPTPGTPANGVGINNSTYLGEPNAWLTINISGTDYVIPAYTP